MIDATKAAHAGQRAREAAEAAHLRYDAAEQLGLLHAHLQQAEHVQRAWDGQKSWQEPAVGHAHAAAEHLRADACESIRLAHSYTEAAENAQRAGEFKKACDLQARARNAAAGVLCAVEDALDAQALGDCPDAWQALSAARECAKAALLSAQQANLSQRFVRGYAHASGEAPDAEYFGEGV